jgi:nucleoside-diphosphate-sugar epimerase
MNINVIGGSGVIGSVLVRQLVEERVHSFKILDKRPSVDFPEQCVQLDVCDFSSLIKHCSGSDAIINLAAEHSDNVYPESRYYAVNVEGARQVCRAADASGVQIIVFTSSVAVYGFAEPNATEEHEIRPFHHYGKSKYLAEEVFSQWQHADPTKRVLVIIRPTVVFGPGNRGNVYNLLKSIQSGWFVMVGSGKNRKSLAYVENVAAFIRHAITLKPGCHIYNYADKPDFSMNEFVAFARMAMNKKGKILSRFPFFFAIGLGRIADKVAAVLGRSFSISEVRIRKFCSNSTYSTKIGKIGFEPPFDLEEGLLHTVASDFTARAKESSD